MDFISYVIYDTLAMDSLDLKPTSGEVWLLEKKYNIHDELDLRALKTRIHSILWFTYRKQFPEIGETGLTSDVGWGCMHRCGQMVLAQTFIRRYLGKDWSWQSGCRNPTYLRILNMFNDKAVSHYSVHNIALRGNEMDKNVGQWYGPNTVAQVLKKLVAEDKNTDIVIHVAMDNMVVTSEIKNLCKSASMCDSKSDNPLPQNRNQTNRTESSAIGVSRNQYKNFGSDLDWQPLLLIIPLRLGLTSITEKYFEKIKASFTIIGSLGILGGRTNHASYFIGYAGDELIFLDPHTTQLHCPDITSADDETFHCACPGRMTFKSLDPSVAMCYYCDTEEAFDNWCIESQQLLLEPKEDAIFEILEEKPRMLPYHDVEYPDDATCQSFTEAAERLHTSDDEFELL